MNKTKKQYVLLILFDIFINIPYCASTFYDYPITNTTWTLVSSSTSTQLFTARNAHATAVFKNKIWLTGGRSASHQKYNLQYTFSNADVWYSTGGDKWYQESSLVGDFYEQNDDALQPGPLAPWYGRYGHSMTVMDIDKDGENDVMILAGGFAPDAMNDVWVTINGIEWAFVHYAPWSPRAFHGATNFNGTLWILGGSPLNNEVWYITSIMKTDRKRDPLTRAMFLNYTYEIQWMQLEEQPPWSPRLGLGVVSHWYAAYDLPMENATERLLVVAGYGGWPQSSVLYDGLRCRGDVWEYSVNATSNSSYLHHHHHGYTWKLLTADASFGPRAWFGLIVWHGLKPYADVTSSATSRNLGARIWLVGGGYLGTIGIEKSSPSVDLVEGRVDSYWSRDGVNWTRSSIHQGGVGQLKPLWSSSEWARFNITSGTVAFRGVWGLTLVSYNTLTGDEASGDLFLIAGSSDTSSGGLVNRVFKANTPLLCAINGVECNLKGRCVAGVGCQGCTGGDDYCRFGPTTAVKSGASKFLVYDMFIYLFSITALTLVL